MSIASSSEVDPAYKVYRRYKDESEDDWDNGDAKPPLDGGDEIADDDEPPPPPGIVLVQGPPNVGAPRFFEPLDSKRSLRVEQQRRRRVEIIDEEPCSHPDSAVYTMFRNIRYMTNKGNETVVVMAEEKRLELLEKQQMEENKKLLNGLGR
ncbi:hypothetical protein MKW98_031403 [Papaver atlanticum]|uniref:Uncharacterized protein n=1 Tax=Papaver atlanticum TaxID=357466 RepID=A0AAD4X7Y5_9MAGN|nr:hypothetical protein MKW98_031403 [Papaver atlanticum]